jgi:hypothetical protein
MQANTKMFYPRLVDDTNISFTKAQTSLLNKFLRDSMHYKRKHWIAALALQATTAISYLPTGEQEFVREQVAENFRQPT